MTRYLQVTARRSGGGWSTTLADLGAVSAPSLPGLQRMVAELVGETFGEAQVVVTVQPKLPLELGQAVADTRAIREEAASLAVRAEQLVAVTSSRLRGEGLSEQDIAVVLGLPPTASELMPAPPAPVRRPVGRPRKAQSA
jgi:hypothetical protein